jgi:hypothetical protein
MPRFSLKDLFAVMICVAVGLFLIAIADMREPLELKYRNCLGYIGAALTGSGALLLFKRPLLGAIAGLTLVYFIRAL